MMGKTRREKLEAKSRKRNARNAALSTPDAAQAPMMRQPVQPRPRVEAIRPTVERIAYGSIRIPKGKGCQSMPAVDEAHDIIAAMHRARLLTDHQEQAAREWQELKAAVRAELSINEGRSCLDISPAGHDDTDGDPEVMRRWRNAENRLGWVKTGALDWTCVMGRKPANLPLLKTALDAFAAC